MPALPVITPGNWVNAAVIQDTVQIDVVRAQGRGCCVSSTSCKMLLLLNALEHAAQNYMSIEAEKQTDCLHPHADNLVLEALEITFTESHQSQTTHGDCPTCAQHSCSLQLPAAHITMKLNDKLA